MSPDRRGSGRGRSLGFAAKLAGGFSLVMLALCGVAIVSLLRVTRSAGDETDAWRGLEAVVAAERLRSANESVAAAGRGYLISRSPEFLRRIEEADITFDTTLTDLRARVHARSRVDLLGDVAAAAADYHQAHAHLIEIAESVDATEVGRHFEREVVPKRRLLRQAIDRFVAHTQALVENGERDTRAAMSRALGTSTLLLSAAMLGSALLAWGVGRDLTRTYRREEEAVRAAERALAARDELLAIVAHDLRTPLSAITMSASLLREAATDHGSRKHGERIGRVANQMDSLIKSLLAAASIEAGRFSVRRARCDVGELVRGAMETLGGLASAKSITLEAHVEQRDVGVLADRDRVVQVLTNLVGNAIKFTFSGGRVDIAAEPDGDDVRFSVSDTGPGIVADHLTHLFERFWKADAAGGLGTGLGLYIAKGIVEAHGGHMWVESDVGHGATFYFTLPREC